MKKNLSSFMQLPFITGTAVLLFEITAISANAQITITSADMPAAEKVYYTASDTLNVTSPGSSGANQQWDFTGWQNHDIDTNYFTDPSTLPGYSSFPSSNLGVVDGNSNIFLNNSSSSLDILGFYTDFGSGPAPLSFVPVQKFISFPSTYQTAYSDTTRYEFTMAYPQPPIDSVRIISTIDYASEIDAWGTLNTPSYSSNCLRQKFTEIKTDSTFTHVAGTWSSAGAPAIDTTVSYRWWSNTEGYPVAEVQTDGSGNVTSASYLTTPLPPAQISFTAYPMNGCAPLTVDFTNTSSGGVYYEWNFNDGNTYNGFDTSHTFDLAGTYYVTLAAADSFGNFLGYAYTIIKVDGSAGFFEMTADSACPGDAVNFEGQDGALDYDWNFGDGATASGDQWISHTYSSAGTYTVTLIVTTTCGTDTIIQDIVIGNNVTPATGFYVWPMEVCPNQPVNLYSFPAGNNYQWNFGDGTSGSGQFVTHSYPSLGTYTITCIVTNSCGNSSTSTANVTLIPNAQFQPGIGINYWPQPACPGTDIFFSAPSEMASYVWNFGDGSPADTTSTNDLTHDYSTIGVYTVSVTITNYCGNDTTLTTSVVIDNNVPFNGWFDVNIMPSPACPGSTIYFEAWSNDAVSYEWNFGDGNSSPNQSANHIYQDTGMYNVSLTMTNSCGNDTIVPLSVDISNNVIPDPNDYDYGVAADTACSGDSVVFYIAPAGSGSYLWNFGDGTSDTISYLFTDGGFSVDITPHVYSANGTYNVFFTLTNQCGNSFTDNFTVTIGSNVPVDGDLWINGGEFCQGDTVKFNALGGASYTWSFGDSSSSLTTFGTITEVFHTYNFSGEYPVSVNIINSCGNTGTYNDTIFIDSCVVAASELLVRENSAFSVYPNPGSGKFKVHFSGKDEFVNGKIRIYNILGESVYITSGISGSSIEIDISGQPKGIYFIQINSEGKVYYHKIIIE